MNLNVIFKALANPMRRQILAWLKRPDYYVSPVARTRVGATASEMQRLCGLAQSTVSAHLQILVRADLITLTKVGQVSLYHRNEVTLNRLKEHAHQMLYFVASQDVR
ncbi:helix-turn-helix domain-containing protein [Paraburkholderia sp. USG1]|uniref:ArsR/SmtB family transcription factor n=1 Tax=Paraburkholderia sp. USG1 TaxID=2952268 RepID=UPI002870B0F5|nr:helix-turn-helix domain-containing protein [Paraburkholderia sp. USG1]